MVRTQVYLRKEELEALRMAAARSGRSIAELIRDAIRKRLAILASPSANRHVRPLDLELKHPVSLQPAPP
jgi:hypothetical protein